MQTGTNSNTYWNMSNYGIGAQCWYQSGIIKDFRYPTFLGEPRRPSMPRFPLQQQALGHRNWSSYCIQKRNIPLLNLRQSSVTSVGKASFKLENTIGKIEGFSVSQFIRENEHCCAEWKKDPRGEKHKTVRVIINKLLMNERNLHSKDRGNIKLH